MKVDSSEVFDLTSRRVDSNDSANPIRHEKSCDVTGHGQHSRTAPIVAVKVACQSDDGSACNIDLFNVSICFAIINGSTVGGKAERSVSSLKTKTPPPWLANHNVIPGSTLLGIFN